MKTRFYPNEYVFSAKTWIGKIIYSDGDTCNVKPLGFGKNHPHCSAWGCWQQFYSLLLDSLSASARQTWNFHFTYPLLHRLDLWHEVTHFLCWFLPHHVTAASNSQSPHWLKGRFHISKAVWKAVIQKLRALLPGIALCLGIGSFFQIRYNLGTGKRMNLC